MDEDADVFIGAAQEPIVGLDADGPSVERPEGRWPVPAREVKIPFTSLTLPIGRQLRAEQRVHPLVPPSPTSPLGSFLCRDGSWHRLGALGRISLDPLDRQLYLVAVDPGLRLRPRGGGPDRVFEARVATLAPGGSSHLALFRVDLEAAGGVEGPWSRVQERRSFRASHRDGALHLVLDTPEYVRLRRVDVDRVTARLGRGRAPTLTLSAPRVAPSLTAEGLLVEVPFLGASLAPEMFSRIELPSDDDAVRVTTHNGIRRYALGEAFLVGEDAAAVVRMTRLGVPLATLALLALGSLVAFGTGLEVRRRLVPLVLLSGVEALLAMRVLIAWQGAMLEPAAASAAWESVAAYVLVPFVLHGALRLHRSRPMAPALLHGAVALTLAALVLGGAGESAWTVSGWVAVAAASPWILASLARGVGRLLAGPPQRHLRVAVGIAVVLVAARLALLGLLGWKERMSMAGLPPMAVSIWVVPATLVCFALLFCARERPRALLALAGTALALFVVVPLLVSDHGFPLVFSLPVLVLFALPAARSGRSGRDLLLAGPLVLVLLAHIAVAAAPRLGLSRALAGWDPDDIIGARTSATAAEGLLERHLAADRNVLRLWSKLAPEALRRAGTLDAESLSVVMENLRRYASQGVLGGGYLDVPLSAPLRETHLDDNLGAVHLLATFGWLGATLLLLLLWGWALAPERVAAADMADLRPREVFGLLVIWTFLAAALYMLAANTLLVLFTGKNVYLLAAASRSDLVEATLLVFLGLWAFETSPPERRQRATTEVEHLPEAVLA
jgi:hypothetical protein